MHGLIGSFRARPGRRDELVRLMTEGGTAMEGCVSYIVATDPADPDLLWITEVWTSEAAWKASLELAWVKASIERAMPLIAEMGQHTVTIPVAGTGLPT